MATVMQRTGGMLSPSENLLVEICRGGTEAEAAICELGRQGVGPESISAVVADRQAGVAPVAYYFESGRLLRTAARDSGWRPAKSLAGCAVLMVPGEPTVLLAGAFAESIVRALENGALFGDLGPIAGGLYSLGVSRDAAREYELTALQGHALVLVHGSVGVVARARRILAARRDEEGAPGCLARGNA